MKIALFLLPLIALTSNAEDLASAGVKILKANCTQCHSSSVKMSGLDVSVRDGLLKGGTRGAALTPGKSEASPLIQAVRRVGKLAMPPTKALSAEDVNTLARWVEAGAEWPTENITSPKVAAPQWWSFKKPVRPQAPHSDGKWAKNAIDEFILEKLNSEKLAPSQEVDRASLIRRLYFDLTGLPPSADEIDAFVKDKKPGAHSELVERLLASPRYGEKWGRHWLDLVRYSDTMGFEVDSYIADAHRYRDWVIRSFNNDKPYDRFVREQIAGDEFWPEDSSAVTGTGYFCVGPSRDTSPDQTDINREETLTDYVDTTGAAFLGLTLGCARCHDHKFDPLTQRDYYRFRAIFAPAVKTRVMLDRIESESYELSENVREIQLQEIGAQINAVQARCKEALLTGKLSALPADVQTALRLDDSRRTPTQRELATLYANSTRVGDAEILGCFNAAEKVRLDAIESRLVSMFANFRPKPFACGITDVGDYSPRTLLPVRGGGAGEPVIAGVPAIFGGGDIQDRVGPREATGPIPLNPTTGRRRVLADWIAASDNPLTARVAVNRIWQFHFSRGLVATPSDFGTRGRAPSHPELLDWLAVEFVERGWSVKQIHRLILNSATYRQGPNPSPDAAAKDPENIYLSHFSRRRLSAEELRDATLAATGVINFKMGGRPVVPPVGPEELRTLTQPPADAWIVTADAEDHNRRSIYLLQKRTFRPSMMEVFDAPESLVTCPRRDSSTTAPQSLSMLNGAFAMSQSKTLAESLASKYTKPEELVRAAWRRTLSRDPSARELKAGGEFLNSQSGNTGSREGALRELVRSLFNLNEFLYVD